MLVVFELSGRRNEMPEREVTLERATYSCPCINDGCLRSTPTYINDSPCDLLMVIVKHSLTGNCFLVRTNGNSPSCVVLRRILWSNSSIYIVLLSASNSLRSFLHVVVLP